MISRIAVAALLVLLGLSAPSAQLSLMGVGPVTNGSVVLTPCNSTGVYDLSNVCNDIYFLGALK